MRTCTQVKATVTGRGRTACISAALFSLRTIWWKFFRWTYKKTYFKDFFSYMIINLLLIARCESSCPFPFLKLDNLFNKQNSRIVKIHFVALIHTCSSESIWVAFVWSASKLSFIKLHRYGFWLTFAFLAFRFISNNLKHKCEKRFVPNLIRLSNRKVTKD